MNARRDRLKLFPWELTGERITVLPFGGVLALLLMCAPSPSSAVVLRTAAQESAPKYHRLPDGAIGGICVDILRAVERADPAIHFTGHQEFVPFKRLQRNLEKGLIDVFFGMKETPARRKKYHFLEVPLYQLHYVVAARGDDTVTISSLADLQTLGPDGSILTLYGSAASKFLREQGGLQVDDSAKTPAKILEMLRAGRGRFAFYHDLGLKAVLESGGYGAGVRIFPESFATYGQSVAFSKKVHPDVIDRVRRALANLQENGELAAIRRAYNLTE